jgi:hypothetical protein
MLSTNVFRLEKRGETETVVKRYRRNNGTRKQVADKEI